MAEFNFKQWEIATQRAREDIEADMERATKTILKTCGIKADLSPRSKQWLEEYFNNRHE